MNENINCIEFGNLIHRLRQTHGRSKKELAARIGISCRYLEDIENGRKIPKLDTFVKIMNTLHSSADYVLQDSLVIGYKVKSSYVQSVLDKLTQAQRKQVLIVLQALIESYY